MNKYIKDSVIITDYKKRLKGTPLLMSAVSAFFPALLYICCWEI